MSDKKDVPTWQRHATETSAEAAEQEQDASPSAIDRVRKFLEDPAVKDAPLDKKKAFLSSKHVSEEMINRVTGSPDTKDTDGSKDAARQEFEASKVEPSTDGSTEAAKQEFDASKKVPQPSSYVRTTDGSREAAKQEFDASKAVCFSTAEFKATSSSTTSAPALQPRDVPPIITYPEFLLQPQKPPPLVTVSRLINATYIAGALTASAYALSKYIVAPMADNLNDARHDLFKHTTDHVTEFNDKLSKLVSTVPSSASSLPQTPAEFADSDTESITSDPTELFHRDIGTQTSPSLSRRPSVNSDLQAVKPDTVPLKQADRLEIIKSHVSEILEGYESNGASNQTLQESISETRHYLDGLYYTPPSYSWNADNSLNTSGASKDKQPDAAVALKAEIRGVKGVLLSAKRFPSGKVGA